MIRGVLFSFIGQENISVTASLQMNLLKILYTQFISPQSLLKCLIMIFRFPIEFGWWDTRAGGLQFSGHIIGPVAHTRPAICCSTSRRDQPVRVSNKVTKSFIVKILPKTNSNCVRDYWNLSIYNKGLSRENENCSM